MADVVAVPLVHRRSMVGFRSLLAVVFVSSGLWLRPFSLSAPASAETTADRSPATPGPVPTSPIAWRGVVEGYYGPPWPHEDRMDMVRWMGAHGMNIYVHAPKDDPYLHVRWRDPIPDEQMTEYAQEIAAAREAGVAWSPGVSPGIPLFDVAPSRDVCFFCPEDFEVLAAKYQRFHDLGVRTFMLRFDDGPKESSHPGDAIAFGVGDEAYGRMNGHLANRLQARFPDSMVVLVPSDYSGTEQTPYLKGLNDVLDERVLVAWVGAGLVTASRITGDHARAFGDAITRAGMTRRKPLVWDNFPVNDLNGHAFVEPHQSGVHSGVFLPTVLKLPSGPIKGRGADLADAISGFLSNPMGQPQASKVPLATVAAYLNDPLAYTDEPVECPDNPAEATKAGCLSEAAWVAGIKDFGGNMWRPLLDFVNQIRSTVLDHTESPVFVARSKSFEQAFSGPFWQEPWKELVAELIAEARAAPALRAAQAPNPRFLAETSNHLDQLVANTAAGLEATRMLGAQRPTLEISAVVRVPGPHGTVEVRGTTTRADAAAVLAHGAQLAEAEAVMRAMPYSVHGDRVFTDLNAVYVLENRMDEFLNFSHETTAAWLTVSGLAAAGTLTVTVEGTPVAVQPDGSFAATVPVAPNQRVVQVVVTDGAGMETGRLATISNGIGT